MLIIASVNIMISKQHKCQTMKDAWLEETGVIILLWFKSSGLPVVIFKKKKRLAVNVFPVFWLFLCKKCCLLVSFDVFLYTYSSGSLGFLSGKRRGVYKIHTLTDTQSPEAETDREADSWSLRYIVVTFIS